jgi:hypothetical protein
MKLLMLFLAATCLVFGATITCTPTNQNLVTNGSNNSPQVVSCGTITATDGFYITSVAVAMVGTFQDSLASNSHTLLFGVTNSFNASTASGTAGPDLFVGSTGFVTGNFVDTGSILTTLGAVFVTGTATLTGGVLPDNASFTGYIVTTEAPIDGVPEPATFVALGSGLALLGIARLLRRRA